MMIKRVRELTRDRFQPYGSVVDWEGAKLSSTSENHDYWDGVCELHPDGALVCSFLQIKKGIHTPIDEMECHGKTEELLVAVHGDIIVPVALPDRGQNAPDESTIESFYVKQGRGILIKPGIWHALPCTVDSNGSMTLVIFKKNTSFSEDSAVETDIRFAPLRTPFQIEI